MNTYCKRCGHCCRNIYLPYSPDYLKDMLDRDSAEGIHIVQPMLVPISFIPWTHGMWHYSCKHIAKDNKCRIHHLKPPMCSLFPYGNISNTSPHCGYRSKDYAMQTRWKANKLPDLAFLVT